MTFDILQERTKGADGDPVHVMDIPLFKAAAACGDTASVQTIKMISKMTDGSPTLRDSSA